VTLTSRNGTTINLDAEDDDQGRPALPPRPRGHKATKADLVREAHAELTRLATEGAIRPVVHEVAPFLEAPAAIQLLAGGTTTGRIVIEVGQ
jgi:NADPH:quinone reductase-like Zn-dependent oxidoreductase